MGPLADILIKMGMKLMTERFVSRAAVLLSWEVARRTEPLWDDGLVISAAEELGVKLPPKAD
jgi:hypothetical protein